MKLNLQVRNGKKRLILAFTSVNIIDRNNNLKDLTDYPPRYPGKLNCCTILLHNQHKNISQCIGKFHVLNCQEYFFPNLATLAAQENDCMCASHLITKDAVKKRDKTKRKENHLKKSNCINRQYLKYRFIIGGLQVTVYLRSTHIMSRATTPLSDELIHTEKLCDKSHHKSHEMEVTVPASK